MAQEAVRTAVENARILAQAVESDEGEHIKNTWDKHVFLARVMTAFHKLLYY